MSIIIQVTATWLCDCDTCFFWQIRLIMERESANTQTEKQIKGLKDLLDGVTEEANSRKIWNGMADLTPS